MLTRFELFVILRNQVRDRRQVRRSLAVEAVLEEWAPAAGADVETWRLAGLGAGIDAELCEDNPSRRGEVAEELLLTEGASPEVAAAARERLRLRPEEMSPLAAAVAAAEAFVDDVYAAIELGDPLDAIEGFVLARRLVRAAEVRGDEEAIRALACLGRTGLTPERAAELAVAALKRIREDLKL